MELSENQLARIHAALEDIHHNLQDHQTPPPSTRTIATWVAEHLTWKPGSRVLCTDACDLLAQDTGIRVTPKSLAPYVPFARQRSNGHTYYRDVTLT